MYKYLGVQIDASLKLDSTIRARKNTQSTLLKQHWLLKKRKLSGKAKLQVWHSLHRAKWSYAKEVLACVSKPVREWLKSSWYKATKTLLNISSNLNKD